MESNDVYKRDLISALQEASSSVQLVLIDSNEYTKAIVALERARSHAITIADELSQSQRDSMLLIDAVKQILLSASQKEPSAPELPGMLLGAENLLSNLVNAFGLVSASDTNRT